MWGLLILKSSIRASNQIPLEKWQRYLLQVGGLLFKVEESYGSLQIISLALRPLKTRLRQHPRYIQIRISKSAYPRIWM
ncbi:hypothetical protein BDV11DRAFT_201157 [Aspergillus similis]